MSAEAVHIRPHGPRILVRRIAPEAVTGGGILIPEDMREERQREHGLHRAVVIACGPGRRLKCGERDTPAVKPGDTVLLNLAAGMRSALEPGEEHRALVHIDDILGVFDA